LFVEISLTPSYASIIGSCWLEKGGCYVCANIRGGGEFGPEWHQAALKANRCVEIDICYITIRMILFINEGNLLMMILLLWLRISSGKGIVT
jgi:hypothetical protein